MTEEKQIPLVSIIMPAYNCQNYLEEAVASILQQEMSDWELIIIDDCSKDRTWELMKRLAASDPRIRIYRHDRNQGVASTRNHGVREAKGEWIALIDSDDRWKMDKLKKQLQLADTIPDCTFVYTGSAFIEDDGLTIAYTFHIPQKVNAKKLLRQNVISCSSVLIKREYMLRHPMPEVNEIHEDYATWLSILKEVPFAYGIDEPLLIYRKSSSSKTGKKGKSAVMNWRTYQYLGLPVLTSIKYMISYTLHGFAKYSQLWWMSYRIMTQKERFRKLFFYLSTAALLAMLAGIFAYPWFHYYNTYRVIGRRIFVFWGHVVVLGLYIAMHILIGNLFAVFRIIGRRYTDSLLSGIYAILIVNVIFYLQLALIGRWKVPDHCLPMLAVTGCQLAALCLWVCSVNWIYYHIYPPNELLLIYADQSVEILKKELKQHANRFVIGGQMSLDEKQEDIEKEILRHDCVMLGWMPVEIRNHYLEYCYLHKKKCYCQTSLADIMITSSRKIHINDDSIQEFNNYGLSVEQRFIKRLLDLVLSFTALVISSPLLAVTAILIRTIDKNTVLEITECYTRDKEIFERYTFRIADETSGKTTALGRFLEKTQIDELPQLINVLKGEMSLVGPYPTEVHKASEIEKRLREYPFRLAVKAGITGYAQVNYRLYETRKKQLKMDFYYIQNYSLFLDFWIVAATVKVLIDRKSSI